MQAERTARLRGPLFLALAAAFLGTAAYRLSLPAVAFFARSVLGSSMVELGFFTTAFFAARALTAVLTGRRADRGLKAGPAAAICFLAHAGVVASYALATCWLHVVFLRTLQGALNGVAWTAIQIAVGAKVSHAIRGRVFSIYFFLGSLGAFAGSALYSCLASCPLEQVVLLSAVFLVLTALSAVKLGSVSSSGRREGRSSAAPREPGGRMGARRDVLLIASISSISLCSRALSSLFVSDVIYVYLNEGLGLSPGAASLLVGLGSLLGMGASTGISWLADRRSDRLALAVATTLLVAGSLTFSLKEARLAIPGFLLLALGVLGLIPLTRRMAMACRRRGLAMGLVNAVGNVGTAISSPVLGSLLEELSGQVIVVGPLVLVPALLLTGTVLALGTLLSAVAAARALLRPVGAPRP